MRKSKITLAVSLAATLGSMQAAQAHTSFVMSDAVAGKSFFGTLNVGHGCEDDTTGEHFDTQRMEVEIPSGVTGIRPMDAEWATSSIVKEGETITKLVWTATGTAHSEDSHLYRASFKATLPNLPMTKIVFPTIQYCKNAEGNEISIEWTGDKSPTLKLKEASKPGWNKYTAQADMDEAAIAAFFSDAYIVWSGDAAYSANTITSELITNKLTAISTGSVYWVKY